MHCSIPAFCEFVHKELLFSHRKITNSESGWIRNRGYQFKLFLSPSPVESESSRCRVAGNISDRIRNGVDLVFGISDRNVGSKGGLREA